MAQPPGQLHQYTPIRRPTLPAPSGPSVGPGAPPATVNPAAPYKEPPLKSQGLFGLDTAAEAAAAVALRGQRAAIEAAQLAFGLAVGNTVKEAVVGFVATSAVEPISSRIAFLKAAVLDQPPIKQRGPFLDLGAPLRTVSGVGITLFGSDSAVERFEKDERDRVREQFAPEVYKQLDLLKQVQQLPIGPDRALLVRALANRVDAVTQILIPSDSGAFDNLEINLLRLADKEDALAALKLRRQQQGQIDVSDTELNGLLNLDMSKRDP